jgi:hypothetical protein
MLALLLLLLWALPLLLVLPLLLGLLLLLLWALLLLLVLPLLLALLLLLLMLALLLLLLLRDRSKAGLMGLNKALPLLEFTATIIRR